MESVVHRDADGDACDHDCRRIEGNVQNRHRGEEHGRRQQVGQRGREEDPPGIGRTRRSGASTVMAAMAKLRTCVVISEFWAEFSSGTTPVSV